MSSVVNPELDSANRRRRLNSEIHASLRELGRQLNLLDHQVGARAGLRDVELACLDLISVHGPINPKALARLAGLHPATLTGVLDRLQRDGWVARERDPSDRRGLLIRARRGRGAELVRLYGGMNGSLDRLCSRYDEAGLALLGDFLQRAAEAGQGAARRLAEG